MFHTTPALAGVVASRHLARRVWARLALLLVVPLVVALILPSDQTYPWFGVLSGAIFAMLWWSVGPWE
jgi:hypothetical protein